MGTLQPFFFLLISDRLSRKFCLRISDFHLNRPSVRRVSEFDSVSLDVRAAVHFPQVRPHQNLLALCQPSHKCRGIDDDYIAYHSSVSDVLTLPSFFSNEQPLDPKMKHFTERLLHSPGLGTRCMEGEPLGWVSDCINGKPWLSGRGTSAQLNAQQTHEINKRAKDEGRDKGQPDRYLLKIRAGASGV